MRQQEHSRYTKRYLYELKRVGAKVLTRAEARIDTGVARLANRWIARRWATFSGTTTELYLTGCKGECLTRKSPEFHLDCNDHGWAASDARDFSWSEGVDRQGAWLSVEMEIDGLRLQLETFMAHQCPGMVRQLHLFNTSSECQRITRVATEILPLDPEAFCPAGDDEEIDRRSDRSGQRVQVYARAAASSGTLLLGGGKHTDLLRYAPNPRYCAVVWSGYQEIHAGKAWTPPPAFIAWQAGPQDPEGAGRLLYDLQDAWLAHSDR